MHIMLDLEGFGTNSNSLIVAIGAVKFDSEGIHSSFYLNTTDSLNKFTLDEGAVRFWLGQGDSTRNVLANPKPVELMDALLDFSEWYKDVAGFNKGNEVWGNGMNYDNALLRNAYKVYKMRCPWHFRQDRDYRTMRNLFTNAELPYIIEGDKHNALDDAKSQALHLIKVYDKLGLTL